MGQFSVTIYGATGSVLSDNQQLYQATRGTELLGALVAFGPEQNLTKLTLNDWDHAGRIGFSSTALGEEGIKTALNAEYEKFGAAYGTPGAKMMFGCFYKALAGSKSFREPGDIAKVFREFVSHHFALPAGAKILKQPLPERLLHTVASLAKEQGLKCQTLRSALVAAQVIPENALSHYPIPVKVGREVASQMVRKVDVTNAPSELGCTRQLVNQLFAERLLTPIYSGDPGIKGRTQKSVNQAEIALLVSKLHGNSIKLAKADVSLVPIEKAAEIAKVPAVTVVHMILGGLLDQVFCIASELGIAALRVEPAEVNARVSSSPWKNSIMDTAGSLKLSPQIVWRLLERHPKEVSMQPKQIDCPTAHHHFPSVDSEEITKFMEQFIHPARIAELCGLRTCEVVSRLKKRGIRPVASKAEVGENFYRTRVLELDLFT
ncbi:MULTISPECIES: hypothetical protein [unclassified Sulfitobacter]|uniref:hypothetical protein n=1 Tax=unclassified Sulfitobacter TaxID=196795 RepID=UPI0007C3CC26|nr:MULTISPECIES: hypothetical protein [unclassified Sulfitobacter]KZX97359.1 hypothetical protein A3720_18210 [Sulfitobacter sp. HI0021]KZY03348.1 hypothetical protein A3722_20785 [Sulfitobacter sp. HI0027]